MNAWRRILVAASTLAALGGYSRAQPAVDPTVIPKAPPLPMQTGRVVRIEHIEELYRAVASAEPGTTILIADGTYYLPRLVRITRNGITIRGESGDRDRVILDGSRCSKRELIWFEGADDCTVADLTLREAPSYGLVVKGEHDTQRTRIYNCKFRNIWVRSIKGTSPSKDPARARTIRPAGGRIEYCIFLADHRKDHSDFDGGNYIAAIDMMWLKDWVVSDNVFLGIQGRTGGGRAAIFLWNNSEDVVVERNIVIDCDRGIAFGNPSGGPLHMTRGIMRNNFIVCGTGKGIELARTKDCRVHNNTVYCRDLRHRYAVHAFQFTEGLELVNNLIRGPAVVVDAGNAVLENNVSGALARHFVDPERGNLHLTERAALAIDRGRAVTGLSEDIDGQPRHGPPDVGADELGRPQRAGEAPGSRRNAPVILPDGTEVVIVGGIAVRRTRRAAGEDRDGAPTESSRPRREDEEPKPAAPPKRAPEPRPRKPHGPQEPSKLLAMLKEAESLFIDGDSDGATELFRKIVAEHPDTEHAQKAKEYLEIME